MRRQVRDLQREVQALEKENARLKDVIDQLRKDPALYEPLARERYFMKKPGEVILYLPPKPPDENGTAHGARNPGDGGQQGKTGGGGLP
jgi:cell division protein FtsB